MCMLTLAYCSIFLYVSGYDSDGKKHFEFLNGHKNGVKLTIKHFSQLLSRSDARRYICFVNIVMVRVGIV
jgi:hypothetical protein